MPTSNPQQSAPQSQENKYYSIQEMDEMLKSWQTSRGTIAPPIHVAEPAPEVPTPIDPDLPKLQSLKGKFTAASKRTGVPIDILAGIASRESNVGRSLNKEGYDPDKQAFGIMQVDQRFHELKGTESPESQRHINQAAEIVRANKQIMDKRFPNWTEEQRWRAAVAGYNMGPDNVKTLENMDVGTTGNNYSEDVMLRAKAYRYRKGK